MIISCVLSHALLPSLLKELSSLWVCSGAVPALLSAAPGEPGVQHNCKQRFIASLAVTHTCGSVFPLTPSLIYFNLILLSGSVIQQEFVEVIWFYLLKKLGILQQIHFKNSYSKGKLLPLLLLYVIMFVFIYCLFPLFFVVGGVRSPWKGEYREPRHFSLNKENSAQASLSPTVSPVSETGSDPKLSIKVSCASPVLPPPSLEQTEEVEGTHWNEGKELPETYDPLPLSSTPLPLKSCSHVERATTISEQELQQLEIGERWAGGGIQLFFCLRAG